jgi:uncharacterized MAPEG superfamily protein
VYEVPKANGRYATSIRQLLEVHVPLGGARSERALDPTIEPGHEGRRDPLERRAEALFVVAGISVRDGAGDADQRFHRSGVEERERRAPSGVRHAVSARLDEKGDRLPVAMHRLLGIGCDEDGAMGGGTDARPDVNVTVDPDDELPGLRRMGPHAFARAHVDGGGSQEADAIRHESTGTYKPSAEACAKEAPMDSISAFAYLASVAALFAKYVVVTTLQAKGRLGARVFRWPEDALAWGGTRAEEREGETVERAQAVLRNDGETQPFYFVFAAAWVALGAAAVPVVLATGLYVTARVAHTAFFLNPRQPLRNRAFVVGQLVLLAIVVDALRISFGLAS